MAIYGILGRRPAAEQLEAVAAVTDDAVTITSSNPIAGRSRGPTNAPSSILSVGS
jgi:hypothetical protein